MVYKWMAREDYKKLSITQQRVLSKMKEFDLVLVCNEGTNYSAWLEDWDGVFFETINRNTGNALYSSGALKTLDDHNTRNVRKFYFSLSDRYLELSSVN